MNSSAFHELFRILQKRYPNYASLWGKSLEEFGNEWEKEISDNIERVFGVNPNPQEAKPSIRYPLYILGLSHIQEMTFRYQ